MAAVLSIVMDFRGKADLQLACDVVTEINARMLRANPRFPSLYGAGIFYERDGVCYARSIPGACERFLTAERGLKEVRSGRMPGLDCDDIAPWRAAELQVRYGLRDARAVPVRSPGVGWHILVTANGRREDPCKVLGMGPDGQGTRKLQLNLALPIAA